MPRLFCLISARLEYYFRAKLRHPSPIRAIPWALRVAAPLTIGGLLYVFTRPTYLPMFAVAEELSWMEALVAMRCEISEWASLAPRWVVFSLPGALWVYAFQSSLGLVWQGRTSGANAAWLAVPLLACVVWELAQAAKILPGTFDALDIALAVVASALAAFSQWRARAHTLSTDEPDAACGVSVTSARVPRVGCREQEP